MKKILYSIVAGSLLIGASSCSDFLEQKNPAYDSDGFFTTEAGLKQGVTSVYDIIYYGQNFRVPANMVMDMYTAYGLQDVENVTIGAGAGLNPDQGYVSRVWTSNYLMIARANTVISGAEPAIADMSDLAKQYYAEARVLRAYAYYNLVCTFGDVPFFTAPVTVDQYTEGRTDKKIIVDWIIAELIDAGGQLEWKASVRGRIDRAAAYTILGRVGLFGGSHDIGGEGQKYFEAAAQYTGELIKSGSRHLAKNYEELFQYEGQAKAEVRDEALMEVMYSDADMGRLNGHYLLYGHSPRAIGGSSVRFPSQLAVDVFECKDGKRIDESPLYNPCKPSENRDLRMKFTVAGHGDTISFTKTNAANYQRVILNCYEDKIYQWPSRSGKFVKNLPNSDLTAATPSYINTGIGYVWRKYCNDINQALVNGQVYTNIIILRYAESLLTYAEAKIELGQLDQSVYDAIDAVRLRAKQPAVSDDRKGDINKMRQLVRRERKAELMGEGLMHADMRRWHIGDLVNAYPSYGYPKAEFGGYDGLSKDERPTFRWGDDPERTDLNDVPNYEAYKDKLRVRDRNRYWDPKFMWWPIPRTETDRDPSLTNPDY